MPQRLKLTDRKLKALKPAPAGQRIEIFDAIVPSLMIRVTDKGHRSFALYTRVPNADGSRTPARLAIGDSPATTLDRAREKARDWLELIDRGKDPRQELVAQRQEEQRRRAGSFGAVAEDFLRRYGPTIEKRTDLETTIRSDFLRQERKTVDGKATWVDTKEPGWRDKLIGDIARADVVAVIDRIVDRGARYQAHNALGYIRRLFNWAIGRGVYGLESSPCDRLKPKDVIGKRAVRKRVLSDHELRAVWRAAVSMAYPFGDLFRMLMLTGQRESDVAESTWAEFDLSKGLWTISAERMKSDVAHVVPLAPAIIELLESLPRFNGGAFLFSTTNGRRPVSGFSKAKDRLDTLTLADLQKQAQERGEDAAAVKLDRFVLHDLRRTARTRFSGIPSEDIVRELAIAHKQGGLHDVYDQYSYLNEKRLLLDAWAAQLKSIVEAKPANVTELSAEKARRSQQSGSPAI
jgi:integrase